MINIYWPVFKNLERQFVDLMFDIHIDDNQINVYSLKISDLILRAAIEIESISKDLYLINDGTKTQQIKYDEDAIKHLNQLWLLEKKVIIISSPNCYLTNRVIYPFVKNEKRTGTERLTYKWNNSYQNLKHDRGNSLNFANVKCLFEIMAALFTLNIYFKNEVFNFDVSSQGIDFPINLGSEIFSINLHGWFGYTGVYEYVKRNDFDECIYLTKMTNKSVDDHVRIQKEWHIRQNALINKHPKILKYMEKNKTEKLSFAKAHEVLGQDEYMKIFNQSQSKDFAEVWKKSQYEGVLNKNQI
ncbi:hypothetical protein ACFX5F_13280 [Flavobacterium sp. ZS1P70]|uniref:Uncharacterized protein n=1 Tax=Flavobacterium zhoui TaxID=3230414 RepID=A0ABW6I8U8_9FLAO